MFVLNSRTKRVFRCVGFSSLPRENISVCPPHMKQSWHATVPPRLGPNTASTPAAHDELSVWQREKALALARNLGWVLWRRYFGQLSNVGISRAFPIPIISRGGQPPTPKLGQEGIHPSFICIASRSRWAERASEANNLKKFPCLKKMLSIYPVSTGGRQREK